MVDINLLPGRNKPVTIHRQRVLLALIIGYGLIAITTFYCHSLCIHNIQILNTAYQRALIKLSSPTKSDNSRPPYHQQFACLIHDMILIIHALPPNMQLTNLKQTSRRWQIQGKTTIANNVLIFIKNLSLLKHFKQVVLSQITQKKELIFSLRFNHEQ